MLKRPLVSQQLPLLPPLLHQAQTTSAYMFFVPEGKAPQLTTLEKSSTTRRVRCSGRGRTDTAEDFRRDRTFFRPPSVAKLSPSVVELPPFTQSFREESVVRPGMGRGSWWRCVAFCVRGSRNLLSRRSQSSKSQTSIKSSHRPVLSLLFLGSVAPNHTSSQNNVL